MDRRDNERIRVDLPTLAGALRQAIGTPVERRLHFLYELKCAPDTPITVVAERLGIPYRTALRWVQFLQQEGLHRFIGRKWPASSDDTPPPPSLTSTDIAPPGTPDPEFLDRLFHLLPDTSMATTPKEWGEEMKGWMTRLFPEIDRAGITLVSTIDLLQPRSSTSDIIHNETINTGGGHDGGATRSIHPQHESRWIGAYQSGMRSGAFRAEDYHPPMGQDYYYRMGEGIAVIGSVVLLKSSSKPPISDTTISQFRHLETLIIHLMAAAVGRIQLSHPQIRAFRTALTRLDQRGVLRGRVREVALLHLGGYSNEEIAAQIGISPSTVKSHTSALLQALDFGSIKEMMAWVLTPRSSFTERKGEE